MEYLLYPKKRRDKILITDGELKAIRASCDQTKHSDEMFYNIYDKENKEPILKLAKTAENAEAAHEEITLTKDIRNMLKIDVDHVKTYKVIRQDFITNYLVPHYKKDENLVVELYEIAFNENEVISAEQEELMIALINDYYVSRDKNPDVMHWGGISEMQLFSNAFKVNIKVYEPRSELVDDIISKRCFAQGRCNLYHIDVFSDKCSKMVMKLKKDDVKETVNIGNYEQTIHLLFLPKSEHYMVLQPLYAKTGGKMNTDYKVKYEKYKNKYYDTKYKLKLMGRN